MGKIGAAIEQTRRYYPDLLDTNENLHFMLKCRQFIEMVNGCDTEVSLDKLQGTVTLSINTIIFRSLICHRIHLLSNPPNFINLQIQIYTLIQSILI